MAIKYLAKAAEVVGIRLKVADGTVYDLLPNNMDFHLADPTFEETDWYQLPGRLIGFEFRIIDEGETTQKLVML